MMGTCLILSHVNFIRVTWKLKSSCLWTESAESLHKHHNSQTAQQLQSIIIMFLDLFISLSPTKTLIEN